MQKTKPINFRHHHRSTIIPYKKVYTQRKMSVNQKQAAKKME